MKIRKYIDITVIVTAIVILFFSGQTVLAQDTDLDNLSRNQIQNKKKDGDEFPGVNNIGFDFGYAYLLENAPRYSLTSKADILGFRLSWFYQFKPQALFQASLGYASLASLSINNKSQKISQQYFPLLINIFYLPDFADRSLGIGGGVTIRIAGNRYLENQVEPQSAQIDFLRFRSISRRD